MKKLLNRRFIQSPGRAPSASSRRRLREIPRPVAAEVMRRTANEKAPEQTLHSASRRRSVRLLTSSATRGEAPVAAEVMRRTANEKAPEQTLHSAPRPRSVRLLTSSATRGEAPRSRRSHEADGQ